ncbi:MAG: CPBP family intramembrane metalloprotease [Candidatus Latescibacteria bacterium]|nr:CPBP family intramembrane metalloprotease [Candidatus Latescibacterota bacterium]
MAPGLSIEEAPKKESIQENWPQILQVPLAKGLIWFFLIFIEVKIVWWKFIHPQFAQSPNVIMQVFVEGINLLLIFYFLNRFRPFELRKMIHYDVPAKRVFFLWIYVGISLTAYNLPLYWSYGFGSQPPYFVIECLFDLIGLVILTPIREELLFRGLFYGAIRTKYGRIRAYIINVLVFVGVHEQLYSVVTGGYWSIFFHHLVLLTVISCFLTYLYESKRSLLLCMSFHGAANFNVTIAPLLGFLYGGYIVGK